MEQPPYWMLKKRSRDQYFDDSWEERAFAQDAAGMLGGCVWPPRSYTCSFCKREFRSAQALGGHMNVHRRDRARLKQFSSSSLNGQTLLDPPQNSAYFAKDLITSCPSLMLTSPSKDGNPNPNSHHNHHPTVASTPQKMSTPISIENKVISKQAWNPNIASCFVLTQKKSSPFTPHGDEFDRVEKEIGSKDYEKMNRERSSLSISLVIRQSCQTTIAVNDEDEDENENEDDQGNLRKRRRLDVPPKVVLPRIISGVDEGLSSKVDKGLKSGSLEELDLELRLGS